MLRLAYGLPVAKVKLNTGMLGNCIDMNRSIS